MSILRENKIVLLLHLLHCFGQTRLLGGLLGVLFVLLHEDLHQRLEVLVQPGLSTLLVSTLFIQYT